MLKINIFIVIFLLFSTMTKYINCNKIALAITGGQSIDIQNAKYHVAIIKGNDYICGGSLITYNKVLSAAHCFFVKDQNNKTYELTAEMLSIFAGTDDLNAVDGTYFHSNVIHLEIHSKYNYYLSKFVHDIAMLILTTEVPRNHPNISPVSLRKYHAKDRTKCVVTGWGKISYESAYISGHLIEAQINTIDTDLCNLSYNGIVKAGMICSGIWTGGVDSCVGDSGSPLVCENLLTGIVSHGYQCGHPHLPGIYVDIVYYLDWILKKNVPVCHLKGKYHHNFFNVIIFSIFFIYVVLLLCSRRYECIFYK